MPIIKATPEDSGCYVDGHWGQYAIAHMVERAEGFGYGTAIHFDDGISDELAAQQRITELAARHLAGMGPSDSEGISDNELDELIEASDSVEEWLNENVAPDGYRFGWEDGEFFLWSEDQWDLEDVASLHETYTSGWSNNVGPGHISAD